MVVGNYKHRDTENTTQTIGDEKNRYDAREVGIKLDDRQCSQDGLTGATDGDKNSPAVSDDALVPDWTVLEMKTCN